MIVVGELINASRKAIAAAIREHDGAAIQQVARDEVKHGAHFIDVNAGVFEDREAECLEWLIGQVREATETPCSVDSPSVQAAERALAAHRGSALINSISLESSRLDDFTALLAGSEHHVVALCMGDDGIPTTVDQRLTNAERLVNHLVGKGIPEERIYLDPLLQAVSTSETAGQEFLQAVTTIKQRFPKVHCICGMSNVSFGLPRRKVLNQTFAVMAVAHGLDAAILNPLDEKLMTNILVAETLAGRDQWCERYLNAHRENRLNP
jgi:5-methyltetrahydrofolate corrinoid/iron sulfur protein methyltransferase